MCMVVLVGWTYVNNTEAALVAGTPISGRARIICAQGHGQRRILETVRTRARSCVGAPDGAPACLAALAGLCHVRRPCPDISVGFCAGASA